MNRKDYSETFSKMRFSIHYDFQSLSWLDNTVGFELTLLIYFFGGKKAFLGYEAIVHFTDL